jgi:hypothetical protein
LKLHAHALHFTDHVRVYSILIFELQDFQMRIEPAIPADRQLRGVGGRDFLDDSELDY